jgi:superfamily II DNA or RNA helicase
VDECHRAGSPTNALALRGQYAATLGLSATPERDYDDGFEQQIGPALGSVVFSYDMNQARQDGVIAPFSLVNVRVPMLADEQGEYMKLSRRIVLAAKRRDGDPTSGSEGLKRLLQQRARVASRASYRIPVAVRLVEEHRGARCLVFHEEIEPAEAILRLLKERRHAATIYHSQLSPAVRQDNLRLFRRGVFDVLVSCRALDEGMNVPEACIAVVASATASTRQRVQRLGRVLRPASGKRGAIIYTIYASDVEERRLRAESERLTTAESIAWTQVGGACA